MVANTPTTEDAAAGSMGESLATTPAEVAVKVAALGESVRNLVGMTKDHWRASESALAGVVAQLEKMDGKLDALTISSTKALEDSAAALRKADAAHNLATDVQGDVRLYKMLGRYGVIAGAGLVAFLGWIIERIISLRGAI